MSLILNGTDGLSDVDGTAGTPAIRGTDANTGIFFPAADTIAFSEGGAEAMRIDSSGNVGIGTSAPQTRFQVSGTNGVNGDASRNTIIFDTTNATTGVGGGISFGGYYDGTSSLINDFASIQGFKENSTANNFAGALRFTTRIDGGTPTERMRINSSGNVSCVATTTLGPYIRAGNTNSVANNGTISITNATAGGALVCVYDTGSGNGGVFWVNYSSTVTKIAGDGEAADTGSSFAVYKSAGSHVATFKNRNGITANYTIAVYSALANN
jgi:hypothetical protein